MQSRDITMTTHLSEPVQKILFEITQLSRHQGDRGKLDRCKSVTVQALPFLGASAAMVEPGDSSFHHPSSGSDLEAFGGVGAFDDLN
jgi:hypothetical protein